MVEVSLQREALPAYVLRGLGLYEVHQDEIFGNYQGAGRWLIPSGTESAKLYEVRAGSRPDRDRCECVGFANHRHCSHVVAAHRATKASAVCDCCGYRVLWSDLQQVEEEDGLLSRFPGDVLCDQCQAHHWA